MFIEFINLKPIDGRYFWFLSCCIFMLSAILLLVYVLFHEMNSWKSSWREDHHSAQDATFLAQITNYCFVLPTCVCRICETCDWRWPKAGYPSDVIIFKFSTVLKIHKIYRAFNEGLEGPSCAVLFIFPNARFAWKVRYTSIFRTISGNEKGAANPKSGWVVNGGINIEIVQSLATIFSQKFRFQNQLVTKSSNQQFIVKQF